MSDRRADSQSPGALTMARVCAQEGHRGTPSPSDANFAGTESLAQKNDILSHIGPFLADPPSYRIGCLVPELSKSTCQQPADQ